MNREEFLVELSANPRRAVAATIGQCLDPHVLTSPVMANVADFSTAKQGEQIKTFQAERSDKYVVYDVDPATCDMTAKNVSPTEPVLLAFKGLQTELITYLVTDLLNSEDLSCFADANARLTTSLDVLESRMICWSLLNKGIKGLATGNSSNTLVESISSVVPETGDDIYDLIMKADKIVNPYGSDKLVLTGSNVDFSLSTYMKRKAAIDNFAFDSKAGYDAAGISFQKVIGQVQWTGTLHNVGSAGIATSSSEVAVMDADRFIMVARNGARTGKRPIKVIRREIAPAIAKLMGVTVDGAQRATMTDTIYQNVSGTAQAAIAAWAMESLIYCVTDYRCIAVSPDVSAYLEN